MGNKNFKHNYMNKCKIVHRSRDGMHVVSRKDLVSVKRDMMKYLYVLKTIIDLVEAFQIILFTGYSLW